MRKCKWFLFATCHLPSQCDKYFFDYLNTGLDIYSVLYDKFVLNGHFNAEELEDTLVHFRNCHDASDIAARDKTCFKGLSNPDCIDFVITNKSFQNTIATSIGLSD